MSVLIGHASIDEHGRANSGAAGDQTGKEVCMRSWYNARWNLLLRPTSEAVAEKMASACEVLCKGNLVGYDQYQRNTLWDELEKVGWDPTKLKTKCETDCSAFITALARVAGISVPRASLGGGKFNAPITQTMRQAFTSTGAFRALTNSKYLTVDQYLKRGDILARESGHTALVLGNGAQSAATSTTSTASASSTSDPIGEPSKTTAKREIKATEPALCFSKGFSGEYQCIASVLNIRNGAGMSKKILTQIEKGTTVQCHGYYNTVDTMNWLYVQFCQGNVSYIGFASGDYLKKV